MKREKYLKPQTARELLAMEQGICAGSVMANPKSGVVATKHETGFDESYNIGNPDKSPFEVGDWN